MDQSKPLFSTRGEVHGHVSQTGANCPASRRKHNTIGLLLTMAAAMMAARAAACSPKSRDLSPLYGLYHVVCLLHGSCHHSPGSDIQHESTAETSMRKSCEPPASTTGWEPCSSQHPGCPPASTPLAQNPNGRFQSPTSTRHDTNPTAKQLVSKTSENQPGSQTIP